MATAPDIDEALLRDALNATGAHTAREVIEEGLRTLIRLKNQRELLKLRGKIRWEGDLDAMRTDIDE
ncbi:type II toxin-antitoxin system VapB family antitoxin [Roseomonas aeriglobus]|nr:type II toxin-antitoxin system VapB family antitoxin [Roseomonas aeriglobus]